MGRYRGPPRDQTPAIVTQAYRKGDRRVRCGCGGSASSLPGRTTSVARSERPITRRPAEDVVVDGSATTDAGAAAAGVPVPNGVVDANVVVMGAMAALERRTGPAYAEPTA